MKVSFLVTFYNQKEFVKQSMDSILAIDKPCEWEIVVGDDGSTDGTIDEVKKYVNKYPDNIKLHVMPREDSKKYDSVKRASANRLNILENSTGDFFCTLDGDDFYFDTLFIKESIEIFTQDSSISVIAFGFQYITDNVFEKTVVLPKRMDHKRIDKKEYLKKYYIHSGGCVYKKNFEKKRLNYLKELGYFDDNNIVINSLNYGEMYSISRPIYAYRQTGQSIYTSMNALEQAVLNVQGMDVDSKLLNEHYRKIILQRYISSFIFMYRSRKKIAMVLGDDKYNKYQQGCSTIKPSICLDILNYSKNSYIDRKKLQKIYIGMSMRNLKSIIKQRIKHIIRGI